jgi:hypothetical protein
MTGNQPGHDCALLGPALVPNVPIGSSIEHGFYIVKRARYAGLSSGDVESAFRLRD